MPALTPMAFKGRRAQHLGLSSFCGCTFLGLVESNNQRKPIFLGDPLTNDKPSLKDLGNKT